MTVSTSARAMQTRRVFLKSSIAGTVALCALGCSTFSRLTTRPPVADTRVVDEATSQVESELERLATASKKAKPTVCFIGVSGAGAESFSNATREQLEDGEKFHVLSKSKMQDAFKKSGVKANNVFIPAERKKFVKELDEPIDYLLAGYLEKIPVDESDEDKGKKDVFRLELIDVESSRKSTFVVDL